jgi:hypothetical protein
MKPIYYFLTLLACVLFALVGYSAYPFLNETFVVYQDFSAQMTAPDGSIVYGSAAISTGEDVSLFGQVCELKSDRCEGAPGIPAFSFGADYIVEFGCWRARLTDEGIYSLPEPCT